MQRSGENQTDGFVSRASVSAHGSVAYDPVKTKLSESQAERKVLYGPD